MSKFLGLEQCPSCAERGRDRGRNNLGTYSDGGAHCFSCGYHRAPSFRLTKLIEQEPENVREKAVLPIDFSREIPAEGWKWLLQYGLPYSYWQAHCGFTKKENRLIFTVGSPIAFSAGRALTVGDSKWKIYGDKTNYVETISPQLSNQVVLVEDIISAHKVGQICTAIPLFGTNIYDNVIPKLRRFNAPVVLWLDEDQYIHLPKKIARLQSLLEAPVRHITTAKDPKEYSVQQLKEILE